MESFSEWIANLSDVLKSRTFDYFTKISAATWAQNVWKIFSLIPSEKTCHQRKLKHHSHNLQIKTCLCLPLEIKYCGNQIYNFFILKKQSANYFLYFGSTHSPLNFQHTFQHYLCQKLSFSIYLERCFFLFQGACHIFKPNVIINYCSSSNPCKGPKEICSHVSLKTWFLHILTKIFR